MQSENQRHEFEKIFFFSVPGHKDVWHYKLNCLWNEYATYEGLRIFGTPYCHMFGDWPFMCEPDELEKKFDEIPPFLDILITHDPVYELGNSDVTIQNENQHIGNLPLRNRLEYLYEKYDGLPKFCFCGHIHSGDHSLDTWHEMKFANTSLVDEYYEEAYRPLVLEI
jgi:Icc-related predicted phosphoesterase